MEYLRFKARDAYDFKSVILPNISEQLLQIEGTEDEGNIICIGAVNEKGPQGAAIAQLLADQEVYIHSIYVDPEERRRGVGKELMSGVLTEALAVFSENNDREESPVEVFIHTDYALPSSEKQEFDDFLKSVGFTDFLNLGECYLAEKKDVEKSVIGPALKSDYKNKRDIISFSDLAEDSLEILNELFEDADLQIEPSLSFAIKEGDDLKAYVWAELGIDDEFVIRSSGSEDTTEREFAELLAAVINAIGKENGEFTLVADSEANIQPAVFEKIFKDSDCCFKRSEAGMYVVFE